MVLGPCISVSHTKPETCQNEIALRSCDMDPLASACPGHPWVLETSLRTEQREQHLGGDHQVISVQELARILGLSIPFCHFPSAVSGSHAEGILPLGLGILTRLPPAQTASDSLSLLTGARREPLTQG